jgi:hypothetical protein
VIRWSGLVGAALCVSVAGCGVAESGASKLDERIVDGSRRLLAAGNRFGAALKPFLAGEPGDPAQVGRAHAAMAEEVRELQRGLSDLAPRSPGAAEYIDQYTGFLTLQRELVDGPYAEITQILNGAAVPSPAAIANVRAIIREAATRERYMLEGLRDVRARFRAGVVPPAASSEQPTRGRSVGLG